MTTKEMSAGFKLEYLLTTEFTVSQYQEVSAHWRLGITYYANVSLLVKYMYGLSLKSTKSVVTQQTQEKDDSEREGKTDRRRRREGIFEGHKNLFQVTLCKTFKHPILSDHKSNNVGQKQIV